LARALLDGESEEQLGRRAELAGWPIPESVTVFTAAAAHVGQIVRLVDPLTLRLPGELAPGLDSDNATVLILPNIGDGRAALMGVLHGRSAVVGPTRNWPGAERSYSRVLRALTSLPTPAVAPLDTNDYLMELTLTADEDALFDLRRRMLAPLDDLRPSTALRLAETLRSWLFHLGRRSAVATDHHVHPQTVRYRMSQIEALFGERLRNPDEVLALTIALDRSVDIQDHS